MAADRRCRIGVCMQTGDWKTKHGRIPNVVLGVGEVGEMMDEDDEIENKSESLENGKGGWSPRLERIVEEM